MSVSPSQSTIDSIARLGVPTFVLVVVLFFALPRADRVIEQLAMIETRMAVMAATCGGPRT